MIRTLTYLILFVISSLPVFAQDKVDLKASVSECNGAINIFENGDFTLQFTGKNNGTVQKAYPSLADKISGNQIWCSFIAAENGELDFEASVQHDFVKMVIFRQERNDICGELERGIAEIQRLQIKDGLQEIGLSENVGEGKLYRMELKKGEKIMLLMATAEKSEQQLSLHWNFKPFTEVPVETKLVDLRDDDFAPTVKILIRDKETKLPLIGNITIEGIRSMAALYVGSDIMFNIERPCKLLLQCNVDGYFYRDSEIKIESLENRDIVIELERVSKGKKILIEEIEFVPGTSDIVKSSEPKLNRLKDFLALNSTINIEIQGHVHFEGKNSFAAQRMSEARAKRVMKYLIDNGIDKDRLTAVGYGNTQPVYEDPRFSYEEQANRRVEIMIK